MKRYSTLILLMVCLVFTSTGTGCGKRKNSEVLATIDRTDKITLGEFNDRISKLPERYQDVIKKNRKAFLDELVVDLLIYNEALRKRLDRDKDVQKVFQEAKKKIMMARLLQDEVEKKIIISDDAIKDYYDANQNEFATPEIRRASHILVKTEQEAREILVELSNGRNFEDLAKARSIDFTSKVGGDIGYFTKGQLVPEIDEVSFSLDVGEISGIVKTNLGYHVVKLTEIKEPRIKELSEVKDAIRQALRRMEKKIQFNEFVEGLKEKAQITVNTDLIETLELENQKE